MKRDKAWWAKLTPEERSELWWLERGAKRYGGRSSMIPDDCSECGNCGVPHLGSGLCPPCNSRLQYLLDKANDVLSSRH